MLSRLSARFEPFSRRASFVSRSSALQISVKNASLSSSSSPAAVGSHTTPDDIKRFLEDKKIATEHGFTCFSFVCPGAPKSKSKVVDENSKIFVNAQTGAFVCHQCLNIGDFRTFQNLINSVAHGKQTKQGSRCAAAAGIMDDDEDGGSGKSENANEDLFAGSKRVAQLSEDEYKTLCDRLNIGKTLLQSTFASYDCYASYPSLDAVTFPYHGPASSANSRLRGVKTLSLALTQSGENQSAPTASRMKQRAHRQLFGLFGWQHLTKKTTEIILTANELDAMAVYQSISHSPSSSVAVLSLPCGYQTLPQYILPLLEHFQKVTLWLGSELTVWQAAKQFARKLGEKRCHLVRPNDRFSGPLSALAKGNDLKDLISNAHPAAHKSIVSFSLLRQDVFAELSQSEQVAGVRWRKYTRLNEILKGHRRGELTVFTGPTGAGKTTFISDYSLDLAMQGVATLWGSFEISNVRLCKLMLTQFAGRKLAPSAQLKNDFCVLSDKFEQLPIHFLTFHGSESLKRVVDAMSHAVYVHDIVHVVIDNLQFMMDVESDRTMVDRFQKQDQIIAALRRFATQQQCHVTLVIHPRKEADGQPLTNSSIFGGVKAVQEADNVMLLQPSAAPPSAPPGGFYGGGGGGGGDSSFPSFRNNNQQPSMMGGFGSNSKIIQITKNRFDGELGRLQLRFNRDSLTFEQIGNSAKSSSASDSQNGNGARFFSDPPRPKFFSTPQPAQRPPMPPMPPPQPQPSVKRETPIRVVDPSELIEDDEMSSTSADTYATASASVDALLADLGRSTSSSSN